MLKNEVKQWELQVDHSLFAIEKLDVTVSGIVICTCIRWMVILVHTK